MNNDGPIFQPFHFVHHINIRVCIINRIHVMQRIALLFGPEALARVLAAPHPIILPLLNYVESFDVVIFILT